MGLLDFARDVGKQLFDTDAEAAENIKQHLEVKLSGIENVDVQFDGGVATICGECKTQAVRDRAILLAGNIQGVQRVVADDLNAPKQVQVQETKDEFYEIQRGDTLGAIAKQFYGKASMYVRIFAANRDIIDDPDRIYPGQKIRIPKD